MSGDVVKKRGAKEGKGGVRKEAGLLRDSDVDVVFIRRDICIRRRRIVSLVEERSRRDAAGWIVEFVNYRSSIGGEPGSVDAPVDDFRVCVSEMASRSSGGGRVECTHVVGMEGCKRGINVFDAAGRVGISPVCVRLGRRVGIRVDGLPDGKESVDVCMVQPEDGVKACVWNDTHVPSVADQTVDSIVHVLERVV